jgi:iron(III) transport system ATP-binding protein
VGEWIGIRAQVDHVVTFNRACHMGGRELCQMPCNVPMPPSIQVPLQAQEQKT